MKFFQKHTLPIKTLGLFTLVTVLLWTGFSSITYFMPNNQINHHKSSLTAKSSITQLDAKSSNASYIKKLILKLNNEQKVHNEKKFGPLKSDSLVIIVQVHERIQYLKYLISSLRAAKGVEEILLVFSHDYYNETINELVRKVDFCMMMQVFYPFSLQTHPDVYPGSDPKDCRFGTPKQKLTNTSCPNVLFTDVLDRYRNPIYVQMKLHWWWKANKLFNLDIMRNHDGLALFLEEDMFLLEDFIHVFGRMRKTASSLCPDCKVMSLAGNWEATNILDVDFNQMDEAYVASQFSNMGFAFTRRTWMEMVECSDSYCLYDEYNFDFALQHTFASCLNNAHAMTMNAPRLIHLGICGVHFISDDCDPSETVALIHRILVKFRGKMFPEELRLIDKVQNFRNDVPTGGFADPRDQALCMGMTIK